MELVLTEESKIPMFVKWKEGFVIDRNKVMGTRTRHEMEEDGNKSRKCCQVM
jgi:hypothetical protein